MAIRIIDPSGHIATVARPGEPTLTELQGWVGGSIEVPGAGFRTPDGVTQFVCNEEGKLRDLEPNWTATELYYEAIQRDPRFDLKTLGRSDYLVGTVIVLTAPNLLT
jgi:hypothetical protein